MGQRKFTLYKDIKIGRGWQKAKAAFYSNGKIKPNIIIYKGKEQEHPEGAYYINDRGQWVFAGKAYANKVGHVACFLSHFGIKTGLKKAEYPQYEEKTVTTHTDEELDYLYSRADENQRFFLDFALNSGFRDMELAHAEDTDLVGLLLEVKRKPHLVSTDYPNGFHPKKWHCRKVKVTPAFAARWRERAKKLVGGLMLRASEGGIETHLNDRWLKPLAEGASFQTETHKLRKTWATRLALNGVPLPMLQKLLGHRRLPFETTASLRSADSLLRISTANLCSFGSFFRGLPMIRLEFIFFSVRYHGSE